MGTGEFDSHSWRRFILILERLHVDAVIADELIGGVPQQFRHRWLYIGGSEVRRRLEHDLRRQHVDAFIRKQPTLQFVDEHYTNMVHVHKGNHYIGHSPPINTGSLQAFGELPATAHPGQLRSGSSDRRCAPPARSTPNRMCPVLNACL